MMQTIKLSAGGLLIFVGAEGLLVNVERFLAGRLGAATLVGSILATALFVWLGRMLFTSGYSRGGSAAEAYVSNQRIGLRFVRWGAFVVGMAVIFVVLFASQPMGPPSRGVFQFVGKVMSIGLFVSVLGKFVCLASAGRSNRGPILAACSCEIMIYLLAGFGGGSIFRTLPNIPGSGPVRIVVAAVLGSVAFICFGLYLRGMVRSGEAMEGLRKRVLLWMLAAFLVAPAMLVVYRVASFFVGLIFSFDPAMAVTGGALFSLAPYAFHLGWYMRLIKEISSRLEELPSGSTDLVRPEDTEPPREAGTSTEEAGEGLLGLLRRGARVARFKTVRAKLANVDLRHAYAEVGRLAVELPEGAEYFAEEMEALADLQPAPEPVPDGRPDGSGVSMADRAKRGMRHAADRIKRQRILCAIGQRVAEQGISIPDRGGTLAVVREIQGRIESLEDEINAGGRDSRFSPRNVLLLVGAVAVLLSAGSILFPAKTIDGDRFDESLKEILRDLPGKQRQQLGIAVRDLTLNEAVRLSLSGNWDKRLLTDFLDGMTAQEVIDQYQDYLERTLERNLDELNLRQKEGKPAADVERQLEELRRKLEMFQD